MKKAGIGTDLHATLSDLLDKVAGVGCGLQVEGVLVGSSCSHRLHPLLRPGHHHVHVCQRQQGDKKLTQNLKILYKIAISQ